MKLTITAIAIGLTAGFCSPTYADDNLWRDPYRDTLAEQQRLSDERYQLERSERDMLDRRERYESERRREVRENDSFFGWGERRDRRNKY